jgi:exopolysaccharide biosynthesis polyprenyl glycosylphosphotransferase
MIQRSVVVVSATEIAERWIAYFRQPGLGERYQVVGVFDDRGKRGPQVVNGVPLRGDLEILAEYIRAFGADLVVIALPASATGRLIDIHRKFDGLPVDVHFADAEPPTLRVAADDPFTRPGGWHLAPKQAFDSLASALLIVLLAPLLLAIAALIKLESSGPVMFRQRRFGLNNSAFWVYKFRTMYLDRSDFSGAAATMQNDPRVSRFGRFLRRSSLDELPQLFNVLLGEMSLVGPRPHPIPMQVEGQLYFQAVPNYLFRHQAKPGITGLAQVNGCRGLVATLEQAQRRVDYDLDYVRQHSTWLDVKILWWTVIRAIRLTRDAY